MEATLFKQVGYSLSKLIEDIDIGEIGLPDIQRPFVWTPAKVRDLFDSMYIGFPVDPTHHERLDPLVHSGARLRLWARAEETGSGSVSERDGDRRGIRRVKPNPQGYETPLK